MPEPVRIYQLFVRLFGNTNETNAYDGTLSVNGVGKLVDINHAALAAIRELGVTHVWLTGVLRQATLTDYRHVDPRLAADPPDIVKGRAGSPYAIRDYFDVSPDLAVRLTERLAELRALLDRIHGHGMKALLDFVPNHVSRAYGSVVRPERDFGASDDASAFFSPSNNFFYLVSPPGQSLRLRYPTGAPPREGLTGAYSPEDGGGPRRVPKATGNNQTSPAPSADDWYEAVKLNYGFNFVDGTWSYDPIPDTWRKMDDVLAHWQGLGVDGFRCDFAHWIPVGFWRWAIERAKARRPAYFVAEAYDNPDAVPGFSDAAFAQAGFDALYDYRLYNLVKGIVAGQKWCNDLDGALSDLAAESHLLRYAENHDECRVAAAVRRGDPGNSGFGSPERGFAVTALLQLAGPSPSLLHNGQEVGERGEGITGFGGHHGRTSIFDYGCMPEVARWVNGHAYDGGRLSAAQRRLRAAYATLGRLCTEPAFASGHRYSLQGVNSSSPEYGGNGHWVYGFLRYDLAAERRYLVVVNLDSERAYRPHLRVPGEACRLAALPSGAPVTLEDVLTGERRVTSGDVLSTDGLQIDLPASSARLFQLAPA